MKCLSIYFSDASFLILDCPEAFDYMSGVPKGNALPQNIAEGLRKCKVFVKLREKDTNKFKSSPFLNHILDDGIYSGLFTFDISETCEFLLQMEDEESISLYLEINDYVRVR